MRPEVLRMDRVTLIDGGVTALDHFSLTIEEGEIMGLIAVNATGLPQLLRLLRQNLPIHYGHVYYRDQLVNHALNSRAGYNRVSIIDSRSSLAGDLTVADNVFVLKPGFGKRIIRRSMLRKQLEPFLAEIGVAINADVPARSLSTFQRYVVTLLKAVVAGHKLVVLADAGTMLSEAELQRLHAILRHYAEGGVSFLYVSQHYEEVRQICDRAALMVNGQITKVLSTAKATSEAIQSCFGVADYETLVRTQRGAQVASDRMAPAFAVRNLWMDAIAGLEFAAWPGECVVVQDLDNRVIDSLVSLVTGETRPESGYIRIDGRPLSPKRRDVAIIQKLAAQTMLFPELSTLDNLCFSMDHRLPQVWRNERLRRGIQREYASWLGNDIFALPIDALTQTQRYDLVYARVLLQRPKAVLCVQPFMQGDVAQRMHIWTLLEKLLERKIAVVILAINLGDTLSLADRLIRVENGRVLATYAREEFGRLPEHAPWRHLFVQKTENPRGDS